MNGVDIAVVVIVLLFVAFVISVRFIVPKLMNRKIRRKGKNKGCGCSKCK